jgi:peroxiredoxin (alkyl hydroperoxide reductase subunit C)
MSYLVGRPAPGFTAPTVLADDTIREDYSLEETAGRYRYLFFYPLDFSIVCPTELLALNERLEEFRSRECEIVAISVDSTYSHLAWKKTSLEDGGIGPVAFPMVSDLTKEISRAYDVLFEDGTSLRAAFLLDPQGTVRHATVNGPDVGRNVEEMLRTVDAVRRVDETGELCPANWSEKKAGHSKGAPPAGIKKKLQAFDLGG